MQKLKVPRGKLQFAGNSLTLGCIRHTTNYKQPSKKFDTRLKHRKSARLP